jgi:hypothetical protein
MTSYETSYNDNLPDQVTPAESAERNKRYYEQPGGSIYANGFPTAPATSPAMTSKPGSPDGVPVPAPAAGTGRAEVPRSVLVAQGLEGPMGMGRESPLEKSAPRDPGADEAAGGTSRAFSLAKPFQKGPIELPSRRMGRHIFSTHCRGARDSNGLADSAAGNASSRS